MPINELRIQAYQLLALALEAHEAGRSADAYEFTAKAMEHLQDAMSVAELRRASSSIAQTQAAGAGVTAAKPTRRDH
jgi:hypothetical protein